LDNEVPVGHILASNGGIFMTPQMPHLCKFGCYLPIIYRTLYEKHVPFHRYVDFHYRDFPET